MTQTDNNLLKKVMAHAKEYGFIFPSSEIYDGLSAVYDYGPNGVALKNNIKAYWWQWMTQYCDHIVGIDTSIFMHPTVWKASGHVDAFNDPLIDNKDSKKRYRADVLIEEAIAKIEAKVEKEIEKAKKRYGESFDEETYRSTNTRVLDYQKKMDTINERMKTAIDSADLTALKQLIIDLEIADPLSGSRHWTDVRQFNLMFSTDMGSLQDEATKIYLRPETAQGIFVNFLNVQKTSRLKIPFGIAQIGKAFRNEIIARQFIFRMREFEQMEMQFFVKPGEEMKWYNFWKEKRMQWHWALGLGKERYRFFDHPNLAHYANAACDIQYDFPMGFKELEGIHSRTDFDLKSHEKHSMKKLRYFDSENNQSYVPYVVETSLGLDRMFLSVLSQSYQQEQLPSSSTEDGHSHERIVLKIPPALAPYKVAVLPLIKKDGLPEKAKIIMNSLRLDFPCYYEDKDTIGKRYRRMDAIGTPFCITIDHQTVQDDTITIRYRDTMAQDRMPISALKETLNTSCSLADLIKQTK